MVAIAVGVEQVAGYLQQGGEQKADGRGAIKDALPAEINQQERHQETGQNTAQGNAGLLNRENQSDMFGRCETRQNIAR